MKIPRLRRHMRSGDNDRFTRRGARPNGRNVPTATLLDSHLVTPSRLCPEKRHALAATDLEHMGEVLSLQQAISNFTDAQAVASNAPRVFKGSQIEAIWQRREEILSGLV